jgi:hypothetical protein
MLQTIRIWRGLRSMGINEWPWRKPWDTLRGWKYSYNTWGGKYFLKRRVERFLVNFEWYIPTKRTREFRREVRRLYLESQIFSLESLVRYCEEKAKELDDGTNIS